MHDHEGAPNAAVCPTCYAADGYAAADADRAVIARRKGNEARHIAAIAGTTEWVHARPDPNDGRLPEAAFDWPIYRAAITAGREAPLVCLGCGVEDNFLDIMGEASCRSCGRVIQEDDWDDWRHG